MRMFRPFSWIADRGCDKVVDVQRHIMAQATRPVVEIVSGIAAKRKREDAMDLSQPPPEFHAAKRVKLDTLETLRSPEIKMEIELEDQVNVETEPVALPSVNSSRVREAIESQFSLQILLKHDELRLINQELAKCQVALEQLRRCHLIPYPTAQETPESMLSIVNGTGPTLSQGTNVPKWAPPYGVTDGPYARHYAKWLIPDPNFDGIQVEWQRGVDGSRAGKSVPEGRATRNSIAEGAPANKSRSFRGVGSQKLQALSNGYPQKTKEKPGPCILKRADGQMVKLVCLDCNRDDFSSTQGFINHCRIGHKRDFKSHEEAAVACGQPITTTDVEEKPVIVSGLVHPMVKTAPMTKDALAAVMSRISDSLELHKNGDPRVPRIPTSANSTPATARSSPSNFVGSSLTPYLSNLMRERGFDQDLSQMVVNAKARVEYVDDESEAEDSESVATPIQQKSLAGIDGSDSPPPPMRVPARAGVSPAPFGRPVSSKGLGITPRPSYATPVIDTSAANQNRPTSHLITTPTMMDHHVPELDVDMLDGPSMTDLSPNTVASNKPPSLVSDDGEYDDGTDADRESSGEDDEDSDVAEIDIEDDAVVARRSLGGNSSDAMRLRKEDKHVTFVSPVKEKEGKLRR